MNKFLAQTEFESLNREYRRDFGFALICTDAEGRVLHGTVAAGRRDQGPACQNARRWNIAEALRWGEPCVDVCPCGFLHWAIPIMHNNTVLGGLLAAGVPIEPVSRKATTPDTGRIHTACRGLLELAERHNLTNSALLQLHRMESLREREKAEGIHLMKTTCYDSIREVYLREEPALLSAIKRGERPAAREIINRILVAIYHASGQRLDLLKSATLELVIMMVRAAVEAGGDPQELLGVNYRSLSDLATIRDEESLCRWLIDMLECLMDAIRDNRRFPNTILLGNALEYMEEHLSSNISREDTAKAAGLSVSHFSHLLKEKTGRTFTDLLNQHRVNHACQLLTRTTKGLVDVAIECGFSDQSYFTRVFTKYVGLTPGHYRRRRPGDSAAGSAEPSPAR